MNNIPLALVDRVDVLTGGASSTYGADAVAGVVNFITRSDFAGMELSVSDQITQRGDGNYLRGDLTIGANFDDGRGNAVIGSAIRNRTRSIRARDRPFEPRARAPRRQQPQLGDVGSVVADGDRLISPGIQHGLR